MTAVLPAPERAPYRAAGFADVTRSEWHKFRTVRSTYWSLLVAVTLGVGVSALISLAASTHYKDASPVDRLQWDPTAISTSGFGLAQLAIGVLGVLMITSEFSTGLIQATLAAVPRRHPVALAKALVFGLVALAVGEVVSFAAFFIGQAIIHANAPSVGIGHRDVLRAVIGSGLYVAVLGLMALGLGIIVRSAAAGIAILVAFIYVLPGVALLLPSGLRHTVLKYWPTQAGQQVTLVYRDAHTLSPWAGLAWMAGFTAVVFAVGVVTLKTRDV